MNGYRTETDGIGKLNIPEDRYYGIQTARALEHFDGIGMTVHPDLIKALITVKKAAATANAQSGLLSNEKKNAISEVCDELLADFDGSHFPVAAMQGGAGTSTNMNVNEVIANKCLEKMGHEKGDYEYMHPINDINLSQSTNDVYPTALRLAAIRKIRLLADALAALQESLQMKENAFADVLKLGRTQLMDALPVTLGQEFGAYARAIARDRWRIYKVEERLREVNIGGTAVGTGLNAPLEYTYRITELLQQMTGLGIARSDLLIDTTQNNDVFVEVFGFLKACAANLIKIANDIRLMSSGPSGGLGELKLKPLQAGSSIMPGKVNPVMPEMMVQIALKTIGSDAVVTQAAYLGQLELNHLMPLIADTLLTTLDELTAGIDRFRLYCIDTLEADAAGCERAVRQSSSLAAALIDRLGYDTCTDIAKKAQQERLAIEDYVVREGILTAEEAVAILSIHQVTQPGLPGRRNL